MLEFFKKYKVKNENLYAIVLVSVGLALFIFFNEPNILFFTNMFVVAWIVFKSKFSFFSVKTVIVNYILFSAFSQYNYGISYGILNVNSIPLYYLYMNVFILIYNSIILGILINSGILQNEQKLLNRQITSSKISAYLCSIIAIASTLISMPTLPFLDHYDRFHALLPGNAWNHIAIIALIFTFPRLKDSKLVKFSYIFVIFWFLAHYERVDVIGLIIAITVLICARKIKKITLKKILILGACFIIIFMVMSYVGEFRMGNGKISFANLAKKILVQNTASDLAYVFNSAIHYSRTEELLLGKTYVTYVVEAIPLLNYDHRTENILQKQYNTPGGDFLLDEPLMNFGFAGVILYPIMELGIYYLILKKQSDYRFILWIFLITTAFRTSWYGLLYIEKGIIYFIPILYFTTKFVNKYWNKFQESKKFDKQS